MATTDAFVRTRDVARRLGISRSTLYSWAANGRISLRKLAPHSRISGMLESELSAFLNSQPAA